MNDRKYEVYLGVYEGAPRDHHAIWIRTEDPLALPESAIAPAGMRVQVTGNIQTGMTFEVKSDVDPTVCLDGKAKHKIGKIESCDLERLIQTCQTLPPPAKQYDGPKRINPGIPLYRCQEWTAEAVQLLIDAGVVRADVS